MKEIIDPEFKSEQFEFCKHLEQMNSDEQKYEHSDHKNILTNILII